MNLLRPVDKVYPISQGYGERPNVYPSTNGHMGLDWACPPGTPICAAADGIVTRAELDTATAANPGAGYGYHVRIRHDNGWTTIYGHLSQVQVKTGQKILSGEIIGLSGNTGFSTGPHLHFEVRTGESIQTTIDPTSMIVNTPPPKEPIFTAKVLDEGKGLRVRSGPGTEFGVLRNLAVGERVEVIGIAGGDAWLWIGDGYIKYQAAWVAVERSKTVIIKRPMKRAGGVV